MVKQKDRNLRQLKIQRLRRERVDIGLSHREKRLVEIFTRAILKQSLSHEPKREILVGFFGVSTVKRNAVSGP